jgi:quercetin dioxygenase-like cupin family protein
MTLDRGYALDPAGALEDLDMGDGSVLSLKVTGRQSRGLVTVLEGVVRSGGPPLHVHGAEDEVVIVLEGQLDYQVGDERGELAAGGLLWFPRQVPHAVANLTGEPCRFITVVTPSGIEDFFRSQRDYLATLAPGSPRTLWSSVPSREPSGVAWSVRRSRRGPSRRGGASSPRSSGGPHGCRRAAGASACSPRPR